MTKILGMLFGVIAFISAWLVFDYRLAKRVAGWLHRHYFIGSLLSGYRTVGSIERELLNKRKSKFVGVLLVILGIVLFFSGF
jgi:uncharacterized membrane protein YbaN (DUF454 family)